MHTGTYLSHEGKVLYSGNWKNHYMHGFGTRYFKNGNNYTGNFEYNSMTGKGTMYYKDGRITKGYFKNEQVIGECLAIYPNGHERKGNKNGKVVLLTLTEPQLFNLPI